MQYQNLEYIAEEIKEKTIFQYIGIQVSVGIGKTKALAKIANKIAKKESSGVCILECKREIDCALRNTKIDDLWGVGRQYRKFLKEHDILTAHDFIKINDNWIRKNLTVVSLRLKKELQEVSCIPLETVLPVKRQLPLHVDLERLLQM